MAGPLTVSLTPAPSTTGDTCCIALQVLDASAKPASGRFVIATWLDGYPGAPPGSLALSTGRLLSASPDGLSAVVLTDANGVALVEIHDPARRAFTPNALLLAGPAVPGSPLLSAHYPARK